MSTESPLQPISTRVLLSDDGQGHDASECATCLTVLGPAPQDPHRLDDCVRTLAMELRSPT